MSGICGGIWSSKTDRELIVSMVASLAHRGGVSAGLHFAPKAGLGVTNNKLLSHNETGTISLIIDGEIYNSKELKDELIKRRHIFNPADTGTEVILHLYEEEGPECLKKLNGNFALAIWDANKGILVLARDRFGIKPLYYYKNNEKTLFASEIKAILASGEVSRAPDDKIIYDFLSTGVHEHTEDTFFNDIKKVMQGEYIVISKEGLKKSKYWQLSKNEFIPQEDVLDKFIGLFEDSVKIRAQAWGGGKPASTGALLSGGLDSSFVVGMLSKFSEPMTFSSHHPDPHLDEQKYINAVLEKYSLNNRKISLQSSDLWKILETCLWHQDEPIRASSSLDHYLVMKFVKDNGVKVLFDGQGGDELLHGYLGHFTQYLNELFGRASFLKLGREALSGIDLIAYGISDRWLGKFDTGEFLSKDFGNKFKRREKQILGECFPEKLKDKAFFAITKYSIPFLLKETERNAGAFGLELRLPLLDHRIVEYVFSLPIEYRIRNGWLKWIFRQYDVLPAPVKLRRRKVGFGTPEMRWTRELGAQIEPIFQGIDSKYIDKTNLLTTFKDFRDGRPLQPDFFWRVATLDVWMKKFGVK